MTQNNSYQFATPWQRTKLTRAKLRHKCCLCQKPIEPGSHYRLRIGLLRAHIACSVEYDTAHFKEKRCQT